MKKLCGTCVCLSCMIIGCMYYSQVLSIETLLKNPKQYEGKSIKVIGYVKELGIFKTSAGFTTSRECHCFALTSLKYPQEYVLPEEYVTPRRTILNVWYKWDTITIDIHQIQNNDLVEVSGIWKNGGIKATKIKKLKKKGGVQ